MNFGQLYFIIIIMISACLPVHRLPAWVQPKNTRSFHYIWNTKGDVWRLIIYGIQKETCGGSLYMEYKRRRVAAHWFVSVVA